MTKSKPTLASLTAEVAEFKGELAEVKSSNVELRNSVSELIALLTKPAKEATTKAEKPTQKATKSTQKAKKPNGNQWFADYKKGKGLELMKNNSGTGKEKSAAWNKLKDAGVHLMLKQSDGSEKHWNSPS